MIGDIMWEYTARTFEGLNNLEQEDLLDQLGKKGWELVAVNKYTFYLKRLIEPKRAQAGFTSNEL